MKGSLNPVELINPIMIIFWAFATVFLYCEFGDNVSSRFDEINDAIYESNWHSLPVYTQKAVPIIMIAAQERVVINGFGNFPLTRDTFKLVFIVLIFHLLNIILCLDLTMYKNQF